MEFNSREWIMSEMATEQVPPDWLAQLIERAHTKFTEAGTSANQMLDAVVSSLEMYPHGGGDIRVMGEVERIKKGSWTRSRAASC